MRLIQNKTAVSHILGFLLIFALSTTFMTSTIYITDTFIDSKTVDAARIQAKDIATQVADALVELGAFKNSQPATTFEKIIQVPTDLAGRRYYVELTEEIVYVKSLDGQVSESITTYNLDELNVGVSGKAYGDTGKIKLSITPTQEIAKFDFDAKGSVTAPGYYSVSLLNSYDPSADLLSGRKYSISITVDNTDLPGPLWPGGLSSADAEERESKDLAEYPILIQLGSSFPFSLCQPNGADILLSYVDNNGNPTGDPLLPYWIEEWDNDPIMGYAWIWTKIDVNMDEEKTIKMYFGVNEETWDYNVDKYGGLDVDGKPKYNRGENIFTFFDDFHPQTPEGYTGIDVDKWIPLPLGPGLSGPFLGTEGEDLDFVTLKEPSYLMANPYEFFFTPPDDPLAASTKGEVNRVNTMHIVDSKIRYRKIDFSMIPEGEPTFDPVTLGGRTTLLVLDNEEDYRGSGFPAGTKVLIRDPGNPSKIIEKNIEEITTDDYVLTAKISIFGGGISDEFRQPEAIFAFPRSLVLPESAQYLDSPGIGINIYRPIEKDDGSARVDAIWNKEFACFDGGGNPPSWEQAKVIGGFDEIYWHDTGSIGIGSYADLRIPVDPPIEVDEYTYDLVIPGSPSIAAGGCYYANGFLALDSNLDKDKLQVLDDYPNNRFYFVSSRDHAVNPAIEAVSLAIGKVYDGFTYNLESSGIDKYFEFSDWAVENQFVILAKLSDWSDTTEDTPLDWNYEIIQANRFDAGTGISIANAQAIQNSVEHDTIGLGGFGIGFIDPDDDTHPGEFMDVDWVRFRQLVIPEPRIYPGSIEGVFYGWKDTDIVRIQEVDRSDPSSLLRDFHMNDEYNTPCSFIIAPLGDWLSEEEKGKLYENNGIITASFILGDNELFAYDKIRIDMISGDQSTYISDINMEMGHFVTKIISLEGIKPDQQIIFKFTDEGEGDGDTQGWPICAITLEMNRRGIQLEAG